SGGDGPGPGPGCAAAEAFRVGLVLYERGEPLGTGMGRDPPALAPRLRGSVRHEPPGRLLRRHRSRRGRAPRGARQPRGVGRARARLCVVRPRAACLAIRPFGGRKLTMGQATFANFRGIVHKGSNGISIVFPDVCKTPVPPSPSPVPIPYPNIVTTDGQMPMVKGAQYTRSSGDEAGVAGGILSSINMSFCEFMLYSFDVKFEGNNVCRMGDQLFHNKKNIMGYRGAANDRHGRGQ